MSEDNNQQSHLSPLHFPQPEPPQIKFHPEYQSYLVNPKLEDLQEPAIQHDLSSEKENVSQQHYQITQLQKLKENHMVTIHAYQNFVDNAKNTLNQCIKQCDQLSLAPESTMQRILKDSYIQFKINYELMINLNYYLQKHLDKCSRVLQKHDTKQKVEQVEPEDKRISITLKRRENNPSFSPNQNVMTICELFPNQTTKQFNQRQDRESLSENQQKRGSYQKYSTEMKEQAINLVSSGISLREVAQQMKIPKKNIRRWLDLGAERKKGGGRKRLDESMERNLFTWCVQESIKQHRPVSRAQIRQKALKLSQFPDKFKASKGWTDKFVKKNDLRKVIIQELQNRGFYQHYQSRKKEEFNKQEASVLIEEKYSSDDDDDDDEDSDSMEEEYHKFKKNKYDESIFASSEEQQYQQKQPQATSTNNQRIENISLFSDLIREKIK